MVVNFISSWLKDIVVLFILISIAQLVMPKGNMKKYIDLIIGFLIIFTIITPFAKIVKKDFSFDETVFNYSNSINLREDKVDFQLEQEKQIERLYKEKIKSEVIKLVEEESSHRVKELRVDLMDEDEVYGAIQYLEIIIKGIDEEVKEKKILIEKVESVDIKKEPASEIKEDKDDYIELKKLISVKYNIEKDKISIIEYE